MNGEVADYRRHPTDPGVDLLSARFVTHRYSRHAHATYTIGLIESGVEEFDYAGSLLRAARGQVALLNPDVVHTGQAGVPGGWRYRVLYPAVDVVRDVAAELGAPGGTPFFPRTVIDDPSVARLLRTVHVSAARGDALASSSALRTALGVIVGRHTARPTRTSGPGRDEAVPRSVRAARDLLHARLADPPSLDELARAVGCRTFALLRAFRAAYGLPPHAYRPTCASSAHARCSTRACDRPRSRRARVSPIRRT